MTANGSAPQPGGDVLRLGLMSSALRGESPEAVCTAASGEGLAAVEWAAGPGQAVELDHGAQKAKELRHLTDDFGLQICGLAVQEGGVLSAGSDCFGRLVEVATLLGAGHIRIFAPPYEGGVVESELASVRAAVADRARMAAASGVLLLVEPSPRTVVPGPEWFLRVAGDLDPTQLGAVYDPGSLIIEGHVAPALAIATFGGYLHHVHVKDVAPRQEAAAWSWAYVPFGEGLVPWAEVVSELRRTDYSGWFVIDHLGGPYSGTRLRKDVAAARSLGRSRPADRHMVEGGEE